LEMCRDDVEAVVAKVNLWKNKFPQGKDLYKFLKENISGFSSLDTAAAFFIFNRITFSGTTESGGYSEQAFSGRFTESSIRRLKQFGPLVHDTKITNFDFQQVIEEQGQNVFLFLDPPYYSATKSALYGKNGNLHRNFDHIRFATTVRNCHHKWLITYDDSEFIRKLFSFANIIEWDLTYGMRNITETSNQTGKELFISNYLIKLPRQHHQKRIQTFN